MNSADGQCSLIEALQNANDSSTGQPNGDCTAGNPAGADTVELATSSTYILTQVADTTDGDNGLPSITTEITINGNGSLIERSSAISTPSFRILRV